MKNINNTIKGVKDLKYKLKVAYEEAKKDPYFKELTDSINLSDDETKFIYMFLKKNWQELLGNPNSLIMDHYRNEFSDENFNKINNLVEYYRGQYSGYLKR